MFTKIRICFFLVLVFIVSFSLQAETDETHSFPPHFILAASFMGDIEMVNVLLAAGVDKDVRTAEGDTALHLAMFQRNHAVTRLLLNHGFNPNAVNNNGETPLHRAVLANNEDGARLLLQFNADRNIRNLAGRTPLQEANRHEDRRRMIFVLR